MTRRVAGVPDRRRETSRAKPARLAGAKLRPRRDLLAATALQAATIMLLSFAAAAQPAPNARPQGGTVVAGSASIAQTRAQTTIAQSSQSAIVDWRSYNIGSQQTVAYQQPNASSITLNRVTGPDPSQIAGKIVANGQIVIVNGSGVIFHDGSQVDAQSLVVSSAGVTNANFMAGRMVFDQPGKADARISNAGNITVGAAGLAALVAPQVVNSGVIAAKMGHVVLAGAETHTVDLYGDGLMSVDVTREVTKAPGGATALVTNTGTILANGGTILLTARAVDGVMQNLVTSTGKLQANSAGGHSGTVTVSAIGGSVSIDGAVLAAGRGAGTTGGTVELNATDTVSIGSKARISATGQAGGGTVAIGTTVPRAQAQGGGVPATAARTVTVAAGARISADARVSGSGGSVALLSTSGTSFAGKVSARGGRRDGDGGDIEISSKTGLQITGSVDASAPHGRVGSLTIDPDTLTIGDTVADSGSQAGAGPQNISATTFNQISAATTLSATTSINLVGNTLLTTNSNPLTLTGTAPTDHPAINIGAPLSVGTSTLTLSGGAITQTAGTVTAGTLAIASVGTVSLPSVNMVGTLGAASSVGGFTLTNGMPLQLVDVVSDPTGLVSFNVTGALNQAGGVITAGTLAVTGTGTVSLPSVNMVGTLGAASSVGGFALTNGMPLQLVDVVSDPTGLVSFNVTGALNQAGGVITAGTLAVTGTGTVSLPSVNMVGTLGAASSVGGFALTNGMPLQLVDVVSDPTGLVSFNVTGALNQAGGVITAGTLAVTGTGTVSLPSVNMVGTLGAASSVGGFALTNGMPLQLVDVVSDPTGLVSFNVTGALNQAGGVITAGTLAVTGTGTVSLPSVNMVGTLGAASSVGGFALTNGMPLQLVDVVNDPTGLISFNVTGALNQAGGVITAGTLAVTGTGTVSLPSVNMVGTLGAASSVGGFAFVDGEALTLTGPVNDLTGLVSFNVTGALNQTGGAITAGTISATATGAITLSGGSMSASSVGLSGAGVTISGGDVTGTSTLTIGTGLTLSGGAALGGGVTVSGAATLSGGTLHAVSSLSVPAGVTFDSGDIYSGDTVSGLTLALGPSISGQIATTGPLLLTGATVASAADVFAGGAATITASGAFHQTAGTIASVGDLHVNALLVDQDAAGAMESSGTLQLIGSGAGAANILGQLAGGTIQVVQPAAALVFDPAASPPGGTLAPGGAATVSVGTLADASSAVLVTAAPGASSPGALRLDGASIMLGAAGAPVVIAAGSIELHSVSGPTSQTNSSLATTTLTGTAGYAGSAATLPVYSPATATSTTATAVTLGSGANQIGTIDTYQVFGDATPGALTVQNAQPLSLTGIIRVGDAALAPITPANAGAAGNSISITTTGSGNGVTLSGTLASSTVLVAAAGTLSEAGAGQIIASLLTSSTGGGGSLSGPNQVSTLGPLGAAGNYILNDAGVPLAIVGAVNVGTHTLGLTSAGLTQTTGGIVTAGTLVGSSSATVDLTTAANRIGAVGPFAVSAGDFKLSDNQDLTVAGAVTAGTPGVAAGTVQLSANDIIVNAAIGACELTGAGGTTTLVAVAPAGTISVNASAVVGGILGVTLEAPGGVAVAGGTIDSPTVDFAASVGGATDLTISATGGLVFGDLVTVTGATQVNGGTLHASILNAGTVGFGGGDLYAGNDLAIAPAATLSGAAATAGNLTVSGASTISAGAVLLAGGSITVTGTGDVAQTGGTVAAAGNVTITANGGVSQTGGTIASGGTILLHGIGKAGTSVSFVGTLEGASVELVEPGYGVAVLPTLGGLTSVTVQGLSNVFHCPGCDTLTPSSTYGSTIPTPAPTASYLRIDGQTVALNGSLSVGTLELHSVRGTTQSTPFSTGLLIGTAGYGVDAGGTGLPTYTTPSGPGGVSLGLANSVASLGPYYVTSGFALASTTGLAVVGPVVAGADQTISLTAPSLSVSANGLLEFGTQAGGAFAAMPGAGTFVLPTVQAGPAVSSTVDLTTDALSLAGATTQIYAQGGIVAIEPLTAGLNVTVGGASTWVVASQLSLIDTLGTPADVGTAGPQTIRLGSLDGTIAATGTLTIAGSIALTNSASTLGLYAQGNITETAGGGISIGGPGAGAGAAVEVGTITGSAGGSVALVGTLGETSFTPATAAAVTPANHFDVLGPFSATGGLYVADSPDANAGLAGLTVQGTIANTGSGGIGLLDAASPAHVGGVIALGTASVAATFTAPGQTVTLVALNGAAGTAAITEAAGSAINVGSAGTLTGLASTTDASASSYDVLLQQSGNAIGTLGQFILGSGGPASVTAQGRLSLVDSLALDVAGQITAKGVTLSAASFVVSGLVGACVVGGAGGDITLTATGASGTIAVSPGVIVGGQSSVTLSAPGGVTETGATLDAPALTVSNGLTLSGGLVYGGIATLTGPTTIGGNATLDASTLVASQPVQFSTGTLLSGSDLSVVAAPTISGLIATTASLSVTNVQTSDATLLAGGAATITAPGAFAQAGGAIAATYMLTLTAGGAITQSSTGTFAAGTTLYVGGSGTTSTFQGVLASPVVEVIETGAALTFEPGTLAGGAAIGFPTALLSYDCPGCATPVAALPIIAPGLSLGGNRPAYLRLDASTLSLGSLAADTVELHSAGSTSQISGTALTALSLSGTAGYAGTSAMLPVYTAYAPGPSIGTLTLDQPGNDIAAVTAYQVRGDTSAGGTAGLLLVDAPAAQVNAAGTTVAASGLTLTGIVRAGPESDPFTATAAIADGKLATIDMLGQSGSLTLNGTLTGSTVTLTSAASGIGESAAGVIVGGTLTGSTAAGTALGTAAAPAANQVATLGTFNVANGDFSLTDARNLAVAGPVTTPNGTATVVAFSGTGTPSASESSPDAVGDLAIQPLATGATVTGKNVALTGTDILVNGNVGACVVGGAGGDITLTATGASGTIAVSPGVIVGGQSSVTLSAPGGVTETGATLDAPALTVSNGLTLSGGLVYGGIATLTGPTAIGGNATLDASTLIASQPVQFSTGTLLSGSDLSVVAAPTISGLIATTASLSVTNVQTSDATLLAGGAATITAPGAFAQAGGAIAATYMLTLTAGGAITQSSTGTLAGGTTLYVGGSGTTSTFQGVLASPVVEVIETSAALTFEPGTLAGGAAIGFPTALLSYDCPGCATPVAALPIIAPGLSLGGNRPAYLRLDASTLSLGSLAADTVELHSAGSTSQISGTALTALSLSGTAGYAGTSAMLPVYTAYAPGPSVGTLTLDQPGNDIAAVTAYQVRGDTSAGGTAGLLLVDAPAAQVNAAGTTVAASGLTLTGIVRAGPESDPFTATAAIADGKLATIDMLGQSGSLTLNGTLTGSTVTLTSAASGIGESAAGVIVGGTLTGSTAAGTALGTAAAPAANQVATLGTFNVANGDFSLTDARNLAVAGPVTTPNGTATVVAFSGTGTPSASESSPDAVGDLAIQPLATGATVTGKNVALTGTDILVNGNVGACVVGGAGGDITLTATGASGAIVIASGAVVGGQSSVTLSAPGGVTETGATLDAPALTVSNGLTLSGGLVYGGIATLTGPTAIGGNATLDASTLVASQPVQFSTGTLLSGSDLSVVAAPTISGLIATTASLSVTNVQTSDATLLAGGAATITAPGAFAQAGGAIAATYMLTLTAGGAITQSSTGTLAGGTTLYVGGSGTTSTFQGVLASPVVEVIETGAALTFEPGTLAGGAAIGFPTALLSYDCPGCATPVAALPIIAPGLSLGGNRPAYLRLDASTLSLGSLAADTVELHSAGSTSQISGTALTALSLSGTAGYAGTSAMLPVYTAYAPGPSVGTLTLDQPGNDIAAVTAYQVRGDTSAGGTAGLLLVDAPAAQVNAAGTTVAASGLTLTGIVRAGPESDPFTATAAIADGKLATIDMLGQSGSLTLNGTLTGSTVTLTSAASGIGESAAGVIVGGTLTGSTAAGTALGTAAAPAANQVATLGTFNVANGDFNLTNSPALLLAGPITAPNGTAAVIAVGDLTIAPLGAAATVAAENVVLTGADILVNGRVEAQSLAGDGGAAVLTALPAGSAPGTITLATAGASAPVVSGQQSLSLVAPGGVFVTSGILNSPNLAIGNSASGMTTGLTLSGGSVFGDTVSITGLTQMTGGLLHATTLVGAIDFAGGDLYGGANLAITPESTITGTVATPGSLTLNGASAFGNISYSASLYAGGDINVAIPAAFTQTGGLIAASGNLTITAAAGVQQAGGTLAAGGTLLVSAPATATGSMSLQGTLSAGTVEIVQAGEALTVAPATITGAAAVAVGPLVNMFDFGEPIQTGAGTSTYAPSLSLGGNRPVYLRLDASTLSLGSLAADTVELHSAGTTSQINGSALTTGILTGTAGYSGTDATLPVYTAYTPGAPVGTVALTQAGNDIDQISGYQIRGDVTSGGTTGLVLVDMPATQTNAQGAQVPTSGLVLTGIIQAGPATDAATSANAQTDGKTIQITLTPSSATLAINGTLDGNLINTAGAGMVTETGIVAAGTLSTGNGTVGSASLNDANQVATLGTFTTTARSGFVLNDTVSLQVNGALATGTGSISIATSGSFTAAASSTIVGASLSAASNMALDLADKIDVAGSIILKGNSISQTGALAGGSLTSNAIAATTLGGSIVLSGTAAVGADTITQTGSLTATTSIMTTSMAGTTISGMVTTLGSLDINAGSLSQSGGTIRAGSLQVSSPGLAMLAGTINLNDTSGIASNSLSINGALSEQSGMLTLNGSSGTTVAGTVSAPAVSIITASAVLTGTTTVTNTLAIRSDSAGGNSANVVLSGVEIAPTFNVYATNVTLNGGTMSIAGSVQPPTTNGAVVLPAIGQTGVYFENVASFTQTGTTMIVSQTQQNTVRIDLMPGGSISLQSFYGPETNLILGVGTGSATGGQITVRNLDVVYDTAADTSLHVDVTGTVNDLIGQGAAGSSNISPKSSQNYRVNSCPIMSVNCVILEPAVVPQGNPLKELSLNFFNAQDDDSDLLIPNITDQGL